MNGDWQDEMREAMKPRRWILGLTRDDCQRAMEEWLRRDAPITLTIRKAKTKGMYCMIIDVYPKQQEAGVYFISWCQRWLKEMKVHINPPYNNAKSN